MSFPPLAATAVAMAHNEGVFSLTSAGTNPMERLRIVNFIYVASVENNVSSVMIKIIRRCFTEIQGRPKCAGKN